MKHLLEVEYPDGIDALEWSQQEGAEKEILELQRENERLKVFLMRSWWRVAWDVLRGRARRFLKHANS